MNAKNPLWKNYHSSNPNKGTDEEVLSMYYDICTLIDLVKQIYGPDNLVLRSFYPEYNELRSTIWARGIQKQVNWE